LEAIEVNAEITQIFASEDFVFNKNESFFNEKIRDLKCDKYLLPDKLFKEISDTDNPQGILAVIKMKDNSFEDIIKKSSFIILLDALQDPGNMGTIIRTAHAGGVDGIILTKGCVDIYNPKTLRATMGSIFSVPVFTLTDIEASITEIKKYGFKVVSTDISTTNKIYDADFKQKIALVIGNEANGICEKILDSSDLRVMIPMPGKAESLNASIATGIFIYEIARQRNK